MKNMTKRYENNFTIATLVSHSFVATDSPKAKNI